MKSPCLGALLLRICNLLILNYGHSARNNMRCKNEILCAGCAKCDAHGAHVVGEMVNYISNRLANSQMTMPAVVLTLRECLVPYWGISMQPSEASTTS